jgi:hypothetical protein
MSKPSSKTSKVLAIIVLTFFIFSAFILSGFTVSTIDSQQQDQPFAMPPLDGGGTGQETDGSGQQSPPPQPVDLIKNGGFELPWTEDAVAPEWEGYRNGQAWASWYKETWPEAIHNGEQAQLMEIFQVEPNILDRFIAIYQTVDVAPNSKYDLTFYAIMRSQVQAQDRNKFEFEMNWGVDYFGEGNFENVEDWVYIPLEEQFRLGSTGQYPEDVPLHYQIVTGTIYTKDMDKITLFIRGWKKFPTGAEVNFDVDDVSLVGPAPGAPRPGPTVVITPQPSMPVTGTTSTRNVSGGVLALGGLVLIVLGASAAAALLKQRKE